MEASLTDRGLARSATLLGLATATALALGGALLGRAFYERDIQAYWLGQTESFVRTVASGSWPVWDPWIGFGQPMLANPAAQVLYPWTWLNLVLDPVTSYTFYVASHLLLGGAGVFRLARRLGCGRLPALVGGVAFLLSGPSLSLVSLWHHLAGAMWMPWVVLAAHGLVCGPSLRRALALAVASAAQVLAGSADMCALTLLVAAAWCACLLSRRRSSALRDPRLIGLLGLGMVLALGLSAAQWLPALEAVSGSSRSALPESLRTFWSLHPVNLLQALIPVFPQGLPMRPEHRALLFESREPFIASVYLGVTTLGLVAAAVLRRGAATARLLLALAILAAMAAFGKHGIIHGLALQALPPLQVLRYPVKIMVVVAFAWSLLAALGAEAWIEASLPGWRWALGVVALPAASAATLATLGESHVAHALATRFLAGGAGPREASRILASPLLSLRVAAGLGALATGLAWLRTRRPGHRVLGPLLLALVAGDLAFSQRELNPTLPRPVLLARSPVLDVWKPGGLARGFVFDYAFRILGKSYRRRWDLAPAEAPAGVSPAAWAVLARGAYLQPPMSRRFGLFGSFETDMLSLAPRPVRDAALFLRATEETPAFDRLLARGGVGFVVAAHQEGLDGLVKLAEFPGYFREAIRVYRVPDPMPRTYAVAEVEALDGLAALRRLADSSFDPTLRLLLPAGARGAPSAPFHGTSQIVSLVPDRVVLRCDLSSLGYVVLLDGFDPGWKATVDGTPTEVRRANVVFRAVAVPEGRHSIVMTYRPSGAAWGVAVSVLSLLAFAVLAARCRTPQSGRQSIEPRDTLTAPEAGS